MSERARELLRDVRVAPSILSADFGRLREQVIEVLAAGARLIHVDVMDGHFVPPITVGPLVVAALAEAVHDAGAMLETHLMIERPERHAEEFVKAGADSITFPAEATPHVAYTAGLIREAGAGVGLARSTPALPWEALRRGDRRDRHGTVHDRQPRLGRAAVHRALAREAAAGARARRRRGRGSRGGQAASTRTRRRRAGRPAPACSSPVPRSSPRRIPARPTARSPRRSTRSDHAPARRCRDGRARPASRRAAPSRRRSRSRFAAAVR